MIACPSCGFEAPDDFAFCPKCATAAAGIARGLAPKSARSSPPSSATSSARRRTGRGRRPRGRRRPPAPLQRPGPQVVESYGGTVEKFIGDAVVAVFGVPATHEDDPERAVRAGLRLVGPSRTCRPSPVTPSRCASGSTPARPSCASTSPRAPARGSSPAMRSTSAPVSRPPLRRWASWSAHSPTSSRARRSSTRHSSRSPPRASASRSRCGSRRNRSPALERRPWTWAPPLSVAPWSSATSPRCSTRLPTPPRLRSPSSSANPASASRASSPQLFAQVDASPRLVTWRQGRCLSYGEGVTFWAAGRDRPVTRRHPRERRR